MQGRSGSCERRIKSPKSAKIRCRRDRTPDVLIEFRGDPPNLICSQENLKKKEAYRYTTCGRRTEILVPRQIRFPFGPMKSGARQFSAPSPTSKVLDSNYFATWRPRSFPRPIPEPRQSRGRAEVEPRQICVPFVYYLFIFFLFFIYCLFISKKNKKTKNDKQ